MIDRDELLGRVFGDRTDCITRIKITERPEFYTALDMALRAPALSMRRPIRTKPKTGKNRDEIKRRRKQRNRP